MIIVLTMIITKTITMTTKNTTIIIIKIGTVTAIIIGMTITPAQVTITTITTTVDQEVTTTVVGDATVVVGDGIESCPKSDDFWHLTFKKGLIAYHQNLNDLCLMYEHVKLLFLL